MINIMIIDDTPDILTALELLIQEYMEDKGVDDNKYNIILKDDPKDALKVIQEIVPDIIFLDIMMPHLSGLDILQQVREDNNLPRQPVIIMSTALGDEETKAKEQELKANAYMVKPFNYKVVSIMLDRYFKLKDDDTILDDEIFDFDFDDLDDLSETSIPHDIKEMDRFNASHRQVSASEFLSQFDEAEIELDEIIELEEDFNTLIYKIEDIEDLEEYKSHIIEVFSKYGRFLHSYNEFEEIYTVIINLIALLNSTNLDDVKKKQYISGFIIAIISDLIEWAQHVFIDADAQDIFYMNASILNSYIQLKDIINKDFKIEK